MSVNTFIIKYNQTHLVGYQMVQKQKKKPPYLPLSIYNTYIYDIYSNTTPTTPHMNITI